MVFYKKMMESATYHFLTGDWKNLQKTGQESCNKQGREKTERLDHYQPFRLNLTHKTKIKHLTPVFGSQYDLAEYYQKYRPFHLDSIDFFWYLC